VSTSPPPAVSTGAAASAAPGLAVTTAAGGTPAHSGWRGGGGGGEVAGGVDPEPLTLNAGGGSAGSGSRSQGGGAGGEPEEGAVHSGSGDASASSGSGGASASLLALASGPPPAAGPAPGGGGSSARTVVDGSGSRREAVRAGSWYRVVTSGSATPTIGSCVWLSMFVCVCPVFVFVRCLLLSCFQPHPPHAHPLSALPLLYRIAHRTASPPMLVSWKYPHVICWQALHQPPQAPTRSQTPATACETLSSAGASWRCARRGSRRRSWRCGPSAGQSPPSLRPAGEP
jgi:hypothetical protein